VNAQFSMGVDSSFRVAFVRKLWAMKRLALVLVLLLLCLLAIAPACSASPDDYIVVEGDTLISIAERTLGDGSRYPEIVALTNAQHASDPSYALIEDPALIHVGWKLAIPGAESAPTPSVMPEFIADTLPPEAKPKGILKSIAKIDDYTVKLSFYRYPRALLTQLAMPMLAMHSPTAIRSWGMDYLYHPVGTGPYLFREWTLDDRVILEANPEYWGEKAKTQRLAFRVIGDPDARASELLTGTVDLAFPLSAEELAAVRGDSNLVTHYAPPLNTGYVAINRDWRDATGGKVLEDVRVRQAISHAINKAAIAQALYPGTAIVARGFMPPGVLGYNGDYDDYNYNPDRARELLREAGYPQGFKADLWMLSVSRAYFPDPLKVAKAIQGDLQAVGIEVELVTYDWDTYQRKVDAGEHALCMLGWIPDFPDPDEYLFPLFSGADKQWAQAGAPDARLLDMLQRARSAVDPRLREQLYYEANAVIHGIAPGVPIVHVGWAAAARPGLSGLKLTPLYDHWNELTYITDTLTIALSADLEGLDIADETDFESLSVGAQLFDGLVAFEPGTTRVKPALAERWEVSPDGLEWIFYLRQGVKFHDGTDFNADAVLFNFDRIWDKAHPYRAGHMGDFHYFTWFFGGFKGEAVE